MKTFHKNRLLKLADFLDNLPRKKFFFGDVVNEFDEKNHCGSVCCAVGWCPTVFPRHWKWTGDTFDDYYVGLKESTTFWDEDAAEFFGIDINEACGLFYPGSTRPWARNTMLADEATPKQVAKSIRQFVKWKEKEFQHG